jgi:hypothetical protein
MASARRRACYTHAANNGSGRHVGPVATGFNLANALGAAEESNRAIARC